jgi:DNA-binding CsgD family transcriptional regulator
MLAEDADEAARGFDEALALHEAARNPFERARTLLAAGERGCGDASGRLEAALATFGELGARPWAERARARLRRAGAPHAAGGVPLAQVLTPHELQVAMVVATGATDREAAAALFLSPRTVEHHLAEIFRKLSLRSRSELSALVARG